MKGKFIRTKTQTTSQTTSKTTQATPKPQTTSKIKTVTKKLPALTAIMMALAMGIEITPVEALAFTNTTSEVKISIEQASSTQSTQIQAKTPMLKSSLWDTVGDSLTDQDNNSSSEDADEDDNLPDDYDPTTEFEDYPSNATKVTPEPTIDPSEDIDDSEDYHDSLWDATPEPTATAKPTYDKEIDYLTKKKLGTFNINAINTKTTAYRFDWIDANAKTLLKGAFSSKYYNDNYWEGLSSDMLGQAVECGNVYRLYNYIPLRKAMEAYFGITNLYSAHDKKDELYPVGYVQKQGSPLSYVLSQNKRMKQALTNKDDRKFLTDLAVKYNITTASDTSAPEAVLAVYYGIVNNDFSNTNYKYNANKKMTREQFYIMAGKFTMGYRALDYDKGTTYKAYKSDFTGIDGFHKTGYTLAKTYNGLKSYKYTSWACGAWECTVSPLTEVKKSQITQGQISKIEVLQMIGNAYASQSYQDRNVSRYNTEGFNYIKVTDKELLQFIKQYKLSKSPATYLKKAKKLDGEYKPSYVLNKSKQLSYTMLANLYRCDKMGIIKKNSKGTINLYAPLTQGQALSLLTKGAMKCKSYYSPYTLEVGF